MLGNESGTVRCKGREFLEQLQFSSVWGSVAQIANWPKTQLITTGSRRVRFQSPSKAGVIFAPRTRTTDFAVNVKAKLCKSSMLLRVFTYLHIFK